MRRGWKHYYRDLQVGDVIMLSDGPKVLLARKSIVRSARTYGHRRYYVHMGTFLHVPTGNVFEERLGNAEIRYEVIWAPREPKP